MDNICVLIMYKYSESSKKRLATCHIDWQNICYQLLKEFDHSVLCGFRNEEDQNKAYTEGNSELKFPYGNHNKIPSMAVDIAPYPRGKDEFADGVLFGIMKEKVFIIAKKLRDQEIISHELRWGGFWKRGDYFHFELIS